MSAQETFDRLIADWKQFQGFIEKIGSQSGKFSENVIAKLQSEYVEKQDIVTVEMTIFLEGQGEILAETTQALATLKHNNSAYDEVEQELILRNAIGALSDDEFQEQIIGLKASMADYTNQVAQYSERIEQIEKMFAEWSIVSGEPTPEMPVATVAEVVKPTVAEVAPAKQVTVESIEEIEPELPEIEEVPEPVIADEFGSFDMDDDLGELGDLPDIPELDQALEPIGDVADDLNFASIEPSPFASIPGEELNFELSNDSLGFDEGLDLSAELIDPDDFSGSIDLASYEMAGDVPSAMLIRDEGVQGSEAIFPFKGEEYRIGRAQDNNIQIKDDNKVSRYHCKLLRKGNQFYVQDLGSSNGTLVNGETFAGEFKLFGGEELKVGETLFRFTIQ